MLLKVGTRKWHIAIEILYYYDEPKQLNLFGIATPLFTFTIVLWEPAVFGVWMHPHRAFRTRRIFKSEEDKGK